MGRVADRSDFDTPVRLRLVEGDLDKADENLAQMNDRIGKMLWALLGILISTTTAAILLALNLAVGR